MNDEDELVESEATWSRARIDAIEMRGRYQPGTPMYQAHTEWEQTCRRKAREAARRDFARQAAQADLVARARRLAVTLQAGGVLPADFYPIMAEVIRRTILAEDKP